MEGKRRANYARRGGQRIVRNGNAEQRALDAVKRRDEQVGNAPVRDGTLSERHNETGERYGGENAGRTTQDETGSRNRTGCNEEETSEEAGGTMLAEYSHKFK